MIFATPTQRTPELVPHLQASLVHKVSVRVEVSQSGQEVVVVAGVSGPAGACSTSALTACSTALITLVDQLQHYAYDLS